MISVFGCNIGYMLEVIHIFKSRSRIVDAGKWNPSLQFFMANLNVDEGINPF
jgi:hypothetical protein